MQNAPVCQETLSRSPAPPSSARGSWRECGFLSIPLALLAVLHMLSSCQSNTPTAIGSFCGNCRGSAHIDLQNDTAIAAVLCSIAWILAYWTGSKLGVAVARAALLACMGMGLVAWGFVWRWW